MKRIFWHVSHPVDKIIGTADLTSDHNVSPSCHLPDIVYLLQSHQLMKKHDRQLIKITTYSIVYRLLEESLP